MRKSYVIELETEAWLTDPQLRMVGPATRGIWIDMLCYMRKAPRRGTVSGTIEDIARMVGATPDDILLFISEARRTNFCDIQICHADVTHDVTPLSRDCHAIVTVINRRMVREEKAKENARLRQKAKRDKAACHDNVTDPTVVVEVINDQDTEKKEEKKKIFFCWQRFKFENVTPDDLRKWRETYPAVEVEAEIRKAEAWQKANPKNKKSNCERFLNNWLSRAQDKAPASRMQAAHQPSRPKGKYRCDKCEAMVDTVADRRGMNLCLLCFRATDPREDEKALERLGISPGAATCH